MQCCCCIERKITLRLKHHLLDIEYLLASPKPIEESKRLLLSHLLQLVIVLLVSETRDRTATLRSMQTSQTAEDYYRACAKD
jgi:hypothetical protein